MEDGDVLLCADHLHKIRVRGECGEEVALEAVGTSRMSEVFQAYAQAKGIEDVNSLQFIGDRKVIDGARTVTSLCYYSDATITSFLPETNARHRIEELLTTETSPGVYSTGSEITGVPIPTVDIVLRDESGRATTRKKLSFPLDANGIETIKESAQRAGVGLPDRTVVNLDVRKTWQIKPRNLLVSNADQALEAALHKVSRDFGLGGDYKIEANLYKLLLYEPGCFFLRHRDNERLDNMFATLVLELPSEYQGAELSVFSPLTPNEKTTYSFNGGIARPKRRTRSSKPGLHFAAFYSDCYHEVSKLTSGHRVALVYHVTATPNNHRSIYCGVTNQWRSGAGSHLPAVPPTPPQPVDESIALRLSKLVELFANEGDEAYPCAKEQLGKPKKLAIVLSHHYTPASLTSIHSLKGSDRAIAELIRAAASCAPSDREVLSLVRLAAKKVVEVGGEEYAANPESIYTHAHNIVTEEFNEEKRGPFFHAAVSLASVWENGETAPFLSECDRNGTSTFQTQGPLLSLTGENIGDLFGPKLAPPAVAATSRQESGRGDGAWHPSWFGGQHSQGPPFQFFGPIDDDSYFPLYDPNGPVIYGEQAFRGWGRNHGNHSLPIYSHELLFSSEEARIKYRKDNDNEKHVLLDSDDLYHETGPKEIEFLGNGMPYPGRIYSRAVILIWPRAHQRDIQMQSKGGRELLANQS
ncbi:hypothetical protein ACHAWF_014939 [Thalassiosira exigua]